MLGRSRVKSRSLMRSVERLRETAEPTAEAPLAHVVRCSCPRFTGWISSCGESPHCFDELLSCERFAEVVRAASQQCVLAVFLHRVGADPHNGYGRVSGIRFHAACRLQAVHSAEPDVHENEIRSFLTQK